MSRVRVRPCGDTRVFLLEGTAEERGSESRRQHGLILKNQCTSF